MSAQEAEGFPTRFEASFTPHLANGTWPRAVDQHLRIVLAPTADSAAYARGAARELLVPHVHAAELDETLILLSEVVTNAARHPVPSAGEQVEVHLAVAPEQIRVEVYDPGAGFDPVALDGRPGDVGGWGLIIVDRAASRWGSSNDDRHCVWFELDRTTPPEATG
ncbi:MAG: ATP-binding protein [Solirubrobacteraceae bacterium]